MSIPSFTSARDYENGFGHSSAEELDTLRKALRAGQDINNPGTSAGLGFPLRVESLEATLKNLTFEMNEIKMFKTIPRVGATNTVEEFNRLKEYSSGGAGEFGLGFMTEGDLPEEEDSTYERVAVLIKFMGVVGRVTHVMASLKAAHGNVIGTETINKTMYLLQQLEYSLFFGDSTLISESFDGLEKLITDFNSASNVVDLRGGTLTEDIVNDVLLLIRDNLGQGTDGYFATGAFSDVAKQVYDRQRFSIAPQPGVLGARVDFFESQNGKIKLHDHLFIKAGPKANASGVGKTEKRPLPATITVNPAAGADALSKFGTGDAGTYIYRVVAGNRFGRSTPLTSASVVVAAGDKVTFTVADGGQGTTYYEIYRTTPGGAAADAKLMVRVARSGATQVITDFNNDIPGCSKGFVLQQNMQSFSWSQLLPMTRIPLAAVDTSIRWAQVLYGSIKMYAPQRNVVIKNIGRTAGSLGL